jgi:ATP-dependent DNA helicase RecG
MPQMIHPDYEIAKLEESGKPLPSFHFGRVVPIYSETEGLHQKTIRKIMAEALRVSLPELEETFSDDLLARLNLPPLRQSFVHLHFPKENPSSHSHYQALRRVVFEEFFVLQLGLQLIKKEREKRKSQALIDDKKWLDAYYKALPFELTGDQKKVVAELESDLKSTVAMTRLVQGDVGSGKTVVALAGCVIAASSGFQSAFMAPTEILAIQHYTLAKKLLEPLGIGVALLSQSTGSDKNILEKIKSGQTSVVIGTHAIFQKTVEFSKLGLVIVDEQHRFGVEQRGELMKKASGYHPHLLMMTATPIPRTLALTLYGDLDLSLIREKPVGRKPIKTWHLGEKQRPKVYSKIRETLTRGEQVYIIYPLVEASEKLDLKSATEMYDKLKKEVFPDFSIGLLHGRLESEEKEQVLKKFKEGEFRILVATTVIEVGIDVANATLMVIEHPERLGLSQLHQLRGRVGRGAAASECLLVIQSGLSPRLKVFEETEDGFTLAEEDLKIRGPGEFLGTRQSGLPGFRVGCLIKDVELLELAQKESQALLETDPELIKPENHRIRELMQQHWGNKIERLRGG